MCFALLTVKMEMSSNPVIFVTMRNQLLRMVAFNAYKYNFVRIEPLVFNRRKVLEFEVYGDKVKTWIDIDDDVWTGFLSKQPGYVAKGAYYPQDCNQTSTDYCLVS